MKMLTFILTLSLLTCVVVSQVDYPDDPTAPRNVVVGSKSHTDYNLATDLNTTYVTPNKRIGYNGYLYSLSYYATISEPFRISILRWDLYYNSGFWNQYGYYYDNNAKMNGSYILVNTTDVIIPPAPGTYTIYLDHPVLVSENDFFGITYGQRNPIPYNLDATANCTKWKNVRSECMLDSCQSNSLTMSCGLSTSYSGINRCEFSSTDALCKDYAVSARVEIYARNTECNAIQMVSDFYPVNISSQKQTFYSHNMNTCWRIRARSANSILYIKAIRFDVEDQSTCSYDKLTIASSGGGTSYGRFCGRRHNTTLLVADTNHLLLRFQTDSSVRKTGFLLEVRSVPNSYYTAYTLNNAMLWPWQDGSWQPTTTSTTSGYQQPWTVTATPASGASAGSEWWESLTLIQKIGSGLGLVALCIFLLGMLIACCYFCCCNKKTVKQRNKVQPSGHVAVPQNKGYVMQQSSVNGTMVHQGVYIIPKGQPSNRLPPLSTHMPYSSRPQHQTHPYPLQRYLQELPPTIPEHPPSTLPPPYPHNNQPRQPTQPPQYSMSTVAFALRQPKPLKPIGEPFGQTGGHTKKTEEELYALGKARLNWNQTVIPSPPVYQDPVRTTTQPTASLQMPNRSNKPSQPGTSGPRQPAGPPPPPPPGYQQQQLRWQPDNQDSWMYMDQDRC